jgi:hypothetical protein
MYLNPHRQRREEILLVLEGEVEATVGSRRLAAGGVAPATTVRGRGDKGTVEAT